MIRLSVALLLLAAGAAGADSATLAQADAVVVHKAARALDLYADGQLIRHIEGIQLGSQPVGAKHFAGDGRTPEGRYVIDRGNEGSAYHLSLHISYPSSDDAGYAAEQGGSPGGAIFLHGQPNDWAGPGRVPGDWTAGCIALSDAEIEALWQQVPDGTPIEIYP